MNISWTDANGIAAVFFSHNATGSFQSYAGMVSDGSYTTLINSSLLYNQQVIGWNSTAFDTAGNLNDSMAMQTFKVENRAPVLAAIPNIAVSEDSNTGLELSSFFSDQDGDNLTYSVADAPGNITIVLNSTSGLANLTPAIDHFGIRYITFNANDGLADTLSNNITINYTNINDAPALSTMPNIAFNEDTYNDSISLDNFVADVDNLDSEIVWTATSINPNVTITITSDRIMNVTAAGNYSGMSTAFLSANDGGGSINSNVFTINVIPVNDAPPMPLLIGPANNSVFSKQNLTLSWNESKDVEGSAITYFIFNSNDSVPLLNTTSASASINITDLALGKTYYWAVVAFDGGLNSTMSEIRQYNTTPNLAPVITSSFPAAANVLMQETQTQPFNITKTDAENNIINTTWYLDNAAVAYEADAFTFTTDLQSAGSRNVTIIVTDAFNATARVTWDVNVTNFNLAPALSVPPDILNATEDIPFIFNITATDADSDILTFTSNRPDFAITKVNYTAIINWTPANSDVGIVAVIFNVTDTGGLYENRTVTISVNNTNDAPVILSSLPGNNPIIFELTGSASFSANATDPDAGDSLNISWHLNSTLVASGTGFTASSLPSGFYNVTFIARDNISLASRQWNLTVTGTPASNQYTSPIFSLNSSQIQNVTGVEINHTSFGGIDFGNNTLNFSGIADLDSAVNITNGVVA
ncbi:hypothetical protein HYU10_04415, partial [Candidatus Woesearchaeota archaeon]|nr:hypothetical protein [Candidatus Woesearchaeota archaeon]